MREKKTQGCFDRHGLLALHLVEVKSLRSPSKHVALQKLWVQRMDIVFADDTQLRALKASLNYPSLLNEKASKLRLNYLPA